MQEEISMSIRVRSKAFAKSLAKSLGITAATILVLSAAQGSARATGTFSTALIACMSSPAILPSPYSPCGSDQFQASGGKGSVTISDTGELTISLTNANFNTTYTANFVALDGSASVALGSVQTDKNGDKTVRMPGAFKFGVVGAGNVVVTSTNNNVVGIDFVSGVTISSSGLPSGQDFEPALVRCSGVTVPAMLKGCGTDPLNNGHAQIENDSGDLTLKINGAATSATYTAVPVAENGTVLPLGSLQPLSTKKGNNSYFLVMDQDYGKTASLSGTVEILSGSTVEFVSGFDVTEHPASPITSAGNLVRCSEVTDPVLSGCGSDPLDTGSSFEVNSAGKLSVSLQGASPSTNYEVYFRLANNSGDVDTGLEAPTGTGGNDSGSVSFFSSGTVAVGTIVVKEKGTSGESEPDQFLGGFAVK